MSPFFETLRDDKIHSTKNSRVFFFSRNPTAYVFRNGLASSFKFSIRTDEKSNSAITQNKVWLQICHNSRTQLIIDIDFDLSLSFNKKTKTVLIMKIQTKEKAFN
jgi:hypothetical protein